MAIQQVGGQGVYVITGSGRDPRKTSNGQSWADLVTKQKYMLYKSAYDQAMREYEAGTITDKERQKRIDQLRKDIRQERAEVARLKRGEMTENQLRERQRQRQNVALGTETIRERPESTTDGTIDSGIPLVSEYQDELRNKNKKLLAQKSTAQSQIKTYESNEDFARALKKKSKGEVLEGKYKAAYDQNIDGYNKAVKDISDFDKERTANQQFIDDMDLMSQSDFEEQYRTRVLKGGDPSTTTGGKTYGGGEVVTKKEFTGQGRYLPDVDYSEQIKESQERIKDIERQILEAESEPADERVNVLERAKEIAREDYGLGQPRRRLFGRRAEMEALGVEPEPEPDAVDAEIAKGEVTETPIEMPTAQRYTVQKGDTLGSIAGQYYGDPKRYMEIAQASGIQDPNQIAVGQELTIPQDQAMLPQVDETPISSPTPAPAPTPTPAMPAEQPRVRRLGSIKRYEEAMNDMSSRQRRQPTPPIEIIKRAFDPVRNLGDKEKQAVGLQMLQQAKEAYGVSSAEYQKAKAQILEQLSKALNPKKSRQMKLVKSLQDNAPSRYDKLGDDIRGLSEDTKRMVIQLFPVSDDTKLEDIEKYYKNAQQQLRLSVSDKSQKKKALDMLDLMYMAVISDKS